MGLSQREAQKTTSPWRNHLSRTTPKTPVRPHHPWDIPETAVLLRRAKAPTSVWLQIVFPASQEAGLSFLILLTGLKMAPCLLLFFCWVVVLLEKVAISFSKRNTTQQKNKRREDEVRIHATLWMDPQSCWAKGARHKGLQVYYSVYLTS